MIQVTGKLVEINNERDGRIAPPMAEKTNATIELPVPDISKIKEGDEVWVRIILDENDKICSEVLVLENGSIKIRTTDIIAHFPKPEQPTELPEEMKDKEV